MQIIQKLKKIVRHLKREILTLYFVCQDTRLPLLPKIIIGITVAYALSPIDLIPDFIPLLGYLDDLIILPLLISLSVKLVPEQILADSREKAENHNHNLKPNRIAALFIVFIWIILAVYLAGYFLKRF